MMCETIESKLKLTRVLDYYPNVSERYYETRYYRNNQKPNCDQCVLLHTNRVCVVTLAPNHDIIKYGKSVKLVDFKVNNKNRLENKVFGKWKKGGQKVTPNSILCRVVCVDTDTNADQCYDIMACINGTIIEVNDKLIQNCNLLTNHTWSDGYIAIILPYRGQHQSQKDTLITSEEYLKLLTQSD